jgi:hypothetical protein
VRQAVVKPASHFVGVARDHKDATWAALIHFDGKQYRLGRFNSEEEAAQKYDEVAGPLRKPVNFPGHGQLQAVKKGSFKYRGVNWHAGSQKWRAVINIDGKKKRLGFCSSEDEAARKYDDAAAPLSLKKTGELSRGAAAEGGRSSSSFGSQDRHGTIAARGGE